ncbi:MAG: glycosyltransferase family 2 protein [Solirubrobacteraceae bacterium]
MVDAVVVSADSRAMVTRCLDHLPRSVHPIVIDNGGTDGTAAALADRATTIHLDTPSGLATAFNRGTAAGRADLVLFLNDDVFATEGAIERLVAELEARPDAVAAGGRLVDADTLETQARYLPAPFPTPARLGLRLSGLRSLRSERPDPELLANTSETIDTTQPAGACLLVRRTVLERIGGWDERFFFWYEDVDICRRLCGEGAVLYVPAAAFRHQGGASFARKDREWSLRAMFHGSLQYAGAHFSRGGRAGLGATVALLALPRVAAFTIARRPALARLYRDVARASLALARGRPVPPLSRPASD